MSSLHSSTSLALKAILKTAINSRVVRITLLILPLVLLLVLLSRPSLKQYSAGGLTFKYPTQYVEQPGSSASSEGETRLASFSKQKPQSYISLAKTPSAKTAAHSLKISELDLIERNAKQRFRAEYKDYEKLAEERVKLSGYDAELLTFSYSGNDGKTKIFVKYIIVISSDAITYITIQSTDRQVLEQDARIITQSFKFTN